MNGNEDQLVVLECAGCQGLMRAVIGDTYGFKTIEAAALIGKVFDDVPETIASAASEAYLCLQAGALHGAVILARAVIEASAKDKGITREHCWARSTSFMKLV